MLTRHAGAAAAAAISALIALGPASAAAPGGAAAGPNLLMQLLPLLLIFVVFYFLLIRPQQKRMKEHRDMVAGLRRGDLVVTSGGIIGKVTRVADTELTVEIAENVRVRVLRGTISEVRAKTEPQPANDDEASEADEAREGDGSR